MPDFDWTLIEGMEFFYSYMILIVTSVVSVLILIYLFIFYQLPHITFHFSYFSVCILRIWCFEEVFILRWYLILQFVKELAFSFAFYRTDIDVRVFFIWLFLIYNFNIRFWGVNLLTCCEITKVFSSLMLQLI